MATKADLELQIKDLEAANSSLEAQIQEVSSSSEPWFNLDQMVLLPESVDDLRNFEYDGIKGCGADVYFLTKKGGTPGSRKHGIDFTNNGFGNLADEVYHRIKSGQRECIIRARYRQNDWKNPQGELVTFDKWRAISIIDIPVSKYAPIQEPVTVEQPVEDPVLV